MEFKILESNGVENENVDGAALNNAMAGGKDGILKGVLNECEVFLSNNTSISVDTGVMMIQGFRIKITTPYSKSFSAAPSAPTDYQLVAKIVLLSTRAVSFELICRLKQDLVKEGLFQAESGTYEAEIATFTHAISGEITDLKLTMGFVSSGAKIPEYKGDVTIE